MPAVLALAALKLAPPLLASALSAARRALAAAGAAAGGGGPVKLALVLRTDLDASKGKLCAMAAHAAVAAYRAAAADARAPARALLRDWALGGEAKVVLRAGSEEELAALLRAARAPGAAGASDGDCEQLFACLVRDAGLTQVPAGSAMALAVFGRADRVDRVTGGLKLL